MSAGTFVVRAMQQGMAELPAMGAPMRPDGLFGQTVTITTNNKVTIDAGTLDVEFSAPFDADPVPNECEVTVYNLSDSSIKKLRLNDTLTIKAGYGVDTGVVFKGKIKKRTTTYTKPDRVTVLNVVDYGVGEEEYKQEFAKGTTAQDILRALVKEAKVKLGRMALPVNRSFRDGVVVEGAVNDLIDEYAAMCGAYAYLSGNVLYIRDIRKKPQLTVTVNETLGMLGSPEEFTEEVVDAKASEEEAQKEDGEKEVKRRQNGVKVKMLLNHRMTVGTRIRLNSANTKGDYSVREGVHSFNGTELVTEVTAIA